MEDRPPITVAVPTYNGARHVADALRGILAQQDVRFDLLISDDRSDDETLAIVRAEAGDRARITINAERLGLAQNWNRCVSLSRTPLVAIFHQDDRMEAGHLASHVAAFADGTAVGLVCSASTVIDEAGRPVPETVVERGGLGPYDLTFARGELVPCLAVDNPLRCSAVTIRASAHTGVGGFDPLYRYVVDWEFWLRVARDWGVTWLARPRVAVRWHPASETHRFRTGTTDLEETARLQADLFARLVGREPEFRRLRRAAERRLARAYLNRAHDTMRAGDASLARNCLLRAVTHSPGILATIAIDPRLALPMAAVVAAPGWAGRWFSRPLRQESGGLGERPGADPGR